MPLPFARDQQKLDQLHRPPFGVDEPVAMDTLRGNERVTYLSTGAHYEPVANDTAESGDTRQLWCLKRLK